MRNHYADRVAVVALLATEPVGIPALERPTEPASCDDPLTTTEIDVAIGASLSHGRRGAIRAGLPQPDRHPAAAGAGPQLSRSLRHRSPVSAGMNCPGAREIAFARSSTVLVDRIDPFARTAAAVSLSCRVCRDGATTSGSPSVEQLTAALAARLEAE